MKTAKKILIFTMNLLIVSVSHVSSADSINTRSQKNAYADGLTFDFAFSKQPYELKFDSQHFTQSPSKAPINLADDKLHVLILTSANDAHYPTMLDLKNRDLSINEKNQRHLFGLADYLSSLKYTIDSSGLSKAITTSVVYLNRNEEQKVIPRYGYKSSRNKSPGEERLKKRCGTAMRFCVDNVIHAPVLDFNYLSFSFFMASDYGLRNDNAFSYIENYMYSTGNFEPNVTLPAIFILGENKKIASVLYQPGWELRHRPGGSTRRESSISLKNTVDALNQIIPMNKGVSLTLPDKANPTLYTGNLKPSRYANTLREFKKNKPLLFNLIKILRDESPRRAKMKFEEIKNILGENLDD